MMAVLACGPGAMSSHHSAAVLLGFPGFRHGAPEISVARRVSGGLPWRVHRSTDLSARDATRRAFIPTTTAERTVIDLASALSFGKLGRLLDDLVVSNQIDLEVLSDRFAPVARRGKPGVAILRAALIERLPGTSRPESELERRLRRLLRHHQLPLPHWQYPLPSGSMSGRVDAAYPERRLIIEVDGRRWHTRIDDFERDRRRDTEAGMAGWTVVRFSWNDIVNNDDWVAKVIRHHMSAAA